MKKILSLLLPVFLLSTMFAECNTSSRAQQIKGVFKFKKRMLAILLSALLVANVSACNYATDDNLQEEVKESTKVDTENLYAGSESESALSPDEKSQIMAVEMYKDALNGFMSGYTPNEFIDWRLSEDDQYLENLSFAILDMNGDDFPELVVNYLGEHAVLSYVTGQTYLYGGNHGIRAMFNIQKDGSFYWTQSAGHEYGAAKYENNLYVEIYRILDNGIDDAEFFVGDKKVTKEELDTFIAQLCHEPADFYDITRENIERYITLEIFNYI